MNGGNHFLIKKHGIVINNAMLNEINKLLISSFNHQEPPLKDMELATGVLDK